MSQWNPRADNLAKLSSYSKSGRRRLVNLRIVKITRSEDGVVCVAGVKNGFQRVSPTRFEEVQPSFLAKGIFVQIIERPTANELNDLPRELKAGAIYAEQMHGPNRRVLLG